MNDIVDKSTRYRQVCQLLLTLNLLINNLSSIFFLLYFISFYVLTIAKKFTNINATNPIGKYSQPTILKRTLLYLTSVYLSNATYMKWRWQKPGAGSHSFHANFLVFTCQESVSTVPNKVSMSQQMTCQEKKAKQINEKWRHKLEQTVVKSTEHWKRL